MQAIFHHSLQQPEPHDILNEDHYGLPSDLPSKCFVEAGMCGGFLVVFFMCCQLL